MQQLGRTMTLALDAACLMAILLFWNTSADPGEHDVKHPCLRPCVEGGKQMVCRYKWLVESYLTLSRACYGCPSIHNQSDCWRPDCVAADGVQRSIRTINRQIPGPPIQVCEGDTIEVDVVNQMVNTEGVTIHWHGFAQKSTPFMDGVAMITQCPIPSATDFTYRFLASDPGTHLYHAHAGIMRADGLFGGIVVRQPPSRDLQGDLYDLDLPEHEIVLSDWSHTPIEDVYSSFYHGTGSQVPESIIIHGRGVYPATRLSLLNNNTTPTAQFQVKRGRRYRFRLVNAGSFRCPLEFSIDHHQLQLIASDGNPIEPLVVDSVLIYSGERYDFVLHTRNEKVGVDWIRVRGHDECAQNGVQQFAILKYHDHSSDETLQYPLESMDYYAPEALRTTRFNSWFIKNTNEADDNNTSYDPTVPDEFALFNRMASVEPDDVSLRRDPDQQILLVFDFHSRPNINFLDPVLYPLHGPGYQGMTSVQVNNISNMMPPSPLLTQLDDIEPDLLCNVSTMADRNCSSQFCECFHRVVAKEGEVVEIVVISGAGKSHFTHPFHLHGYRFRIVALEWLNETLTLERFKEKDARGEISRRLHSAPFKDTFPIPNSGYMILRIIADNPGMWFMHCHVGLHAEIGMSLTLQVNDAQGHLPSPPPNFPRCGSWGRDSLPRSDVNAVKGGNSCLTHSPGNLSSSSSWMAPVLTFLVAVNIVLIIAFTYYVRKRRVDDRRFSLQLGARATRLQSLSRRATSGGRCDVVIDDSESSKLL